MMHPLPPGTLGHYASHEVMGLKDVHACGPLYDDAAYCAAEYALALIYYNTERKLNIRFFEKMLDDPELVSVDDLQLMSTYLGLRGFSRQTSVSTIFEVYCRLPRVVSRNMARYRLSSRNLRVEMGCYNNITWTGRICDFVEPARFTRSSASFVNVKGFAIQERISLSFPEQANGDLKLCGSDPKTVNGLESKCMDQIGDLKC